MWIVDCKMTETIDEINRKYLKIGMNWLEELIQYLTIAIKIDKIDTNEEENKDEIIERNERVEKAIALMKDIKTRREKDFMRWAPEIVPELFNDRIIRVTTSILNDLHEYVEDKLLLQLFKKCYIWMAEWRENVDIDK